MVTEKTEKAPDMKEQTQESLQLKEEIVKTPDLT